MFENFGLFLKHERELRGVPLEEIAEATKVHIRFLEALENNDFERLPGEVFIKGYIRSYARAIGFNAEEMINAYDESVGKSRREEMQTAQAEKERTRSRNAAILKYVILGVVLAGVAVAGKWVVGFVAEKQAQRQAAPEVVEEAPPQETVTTLAQEAAPMDSEVQEETPSTVAAPAAVEEKPSAEQSPPSGKREDKPQAAANSAAPAVTAQGKKPIAPATADKKMDAVEKPAKPQVKPATAPPQEKTEIPKTLAEPAVKENFSDSSGKNVIIQQVGEKPEPVAAASPATESEAKPLHLLIQVQGNSWFNLTVDETDQKDFILPGGTSKSFYADKEFRVTIGNRRGTQIFLNGKALDLPLGGGDVVRDFNITAKNIE